jgi:N,N-dimethylformamidase
MPLIGYVSDERYLAVSGADVELAGAAGTYQLRSTPSGALHGEVPPGRYTATLAREGYGQKRTPVVLDGGEPYQFRLLSERCFGYAWPKWVRTGDSATFRVSSPEPYRLALVRHGAHAEEVALLGWFDEHGPRATVQVTPDGDYTQTGVGWHDSGTIRAPERSGLHFFHGETESGRTFSFPWVVAPAAPRTQIAVLASTNTWNAYNNFGGRSNYVSSTHLPPRPTVVARTDLDRYRAGTPAEHSAPDADYLPLSFERPEPLNQVGRGERPEDPIRGRQPSHLAAAEWRLLAWLEREGYAHDLYAEAQLHDGVLDLDRYRVLILSTHPEYWSRTMFARVRAWVHERGGRLLYLGGNGLDCEVEFLDPATLRFLTQDEDPNGPAENRMHRTYEPTSSLLGVVYTEAGAMMSAPYRVLAEDHWVFAGTGLRDGDLFGCESLQERCPGGASGHETDKRAASTPPGTRLLAKGLNPDDGGAELVYYETDRGGRVFSAGSITWPASVLVDRGVSRITANVIDRFLERA